MPINNGDFETAGLAPGLADGWLLTTQAAAEEIAAYDVALPEAVEDFEEEWFNNELYVFGLDEVLVEAAAYNAIPQSQEGFEDGWTGNENFVFGLVDGSNAIAADYDAALPEQVEDFEQEWSSNEGFFTDFDATPSQQALFDQAGTAEQPEDFEELWQNNENFAFDFVSVPSAPAQWDTSPEPVEDFEEEWPTLVMTSF